MCILGIDQSYTKTAFVIIGDNNGLEEFGVISTNKEENSFSRALSVSCAINDVYLRYTPSIVNIEGLAFGLKGNATRDLAGLQYVILVRLMDIDPNVNFNIITPKSVKKFATDNGNASKKDMINALPDMVKQKFMDRNYKLTTGLADLADAYFIATYQ